MCAEQHDVVKSAKKMPVALTRRQSGHTAQYGTDCSKGADHAHVGIAMVGDLPRSWTMQLTAARQRGHAIGTQIGMNAETRTVLAGCSDCTRATRHMIASMGQTRTHIMTPANRAEHTVAAGSQGKRAKWKRRAKHTIVAGARSAVKPSSCTRVMSTNLVMTIL